MQIVRGGVQFDLPGMRGGESTLSTTAEAAKNGLFLIEQGIFLFINLEERSLSFSTL